MANQLKSIYGNNLNTEGLSPLAKDIEPIRIDTITAAHTDYRAYYYGKQDLTGFKDFAYREFWQLDGAYKALKNSGKTGDWLPESNYPMKVEANQHTPTQASGYVVLIRWLQSALIPFVTTQASGY